MFSIPQQQAGEDSWSKGYKDANHAFLLFLLTSVHVLSGLFLPPRRPCSAHKHHCLYGVLAMSHDSLRSTGRTLTVVPRRPIHSHRLGSNHTLSQFLKDSLRGS